MESTIRYISGREASLVAPSGSENERVSCCCRKTSDSKAKKHGASCDVYASSRSILVANCTLARGHICACVLAIDLGFVTRRRFCTLCLIRYGYLQLLYPLKLYLSIVFVVQVIYEVHEPLHETTVVKERSLQYTISLLPSGLGKRLTLVKEHSLKYTISLLPRPLPVAAPVSLAW